MGRATMSNAFAIQFYEFECRNSYDCINFNGDYFIFMNILNLNLTKLPDSPQFQIFTQASRCNVD
jgi:hypothetical protein